MNFVLDGRFVSPLRLARVLIVGLTGGMGAGKSTVTGLLAERGALIIDADQIARQVVEPGEPAYGAIIRRFGPAVVQPDGRLDRASLASTVFSDPIALSALNAITHPAIAEVMAQQLAAAAGTNRVVVLDIPLLTEAMRYAYRMAAVIVVDAPPEVALRRLVADRGMSEGDARARMATQPSRDERRQMADFVVDNGGSAAELCSAIDRLWEWIGQLADCINALNEQD